MADTRASNCAVEGVQPVSCGKGVEGGGEAHRPRPQGQYWSDFDDWKVRHPSALDSFDKFARQVKGKLVTVFLDYDGTLSPIVSEPDQAFMSEDMRAAVRRVAELYPTAIISGRGRDKVFDFVKLPELYYAGSHGLDIAGPSTGPNAEAAQGAGGSGTVLHQPAPWAPAVMNALYKALEAKIADIPGAAVEHNKFCVSVHYRKCREEDWDRVKDAVEAAISGRDDLRLSNGRKVHEIKPNVVWDKGTALSFLLGQLHLDARGFNAASDVFSLYLGDDVTDEDAFHELKQRAERREEEGQGPDGKEGKGRGDGCGILVSSKPKPTYAAYTLADPSEVLLFLRRLIELADKGETRTTSTTGTGGAGGVSSNKGIGVGSGGGASWGVDGATRAEATSGSKGRKSSGDGGGGGGGGTGRLRLRGGEEAGGDDNEQPAAKSRTRSGRRFSR